MEKMIKISGLDQSHAWSEIDAYIKELVPPAEAHFVLEQDERRVLIDLLGEKQQTVVSSIIYNRNDFRFAIHPQGIIAEVGKFLGMQDVILGYKEFDDRFIIKTNEEEHTANIFADARVREVLESVPELCLEIVQYITEEEDGKVPFLELRVDGLITDTPLLKQLYQAFFKVLKNTDR